jgi:iron complex transport system substrate-binding protein
MLEHEYTDIRTLGQIFNVEEKAEKIINDIKAEIAKGKEFAKGKDPVKAVVLQLRKDGTFRIYGEDSVGGDMATQLGANLLAKDSGNIGAEDLASLNPDVIFTVYYSYFGGSVEMEDAIGKITGHEGLQSVSAVENQRVLPVKLGEVYCSGIRTMDGVKTMLKGLYPDEYND